MALHHRREMPDMRSVYQGNEFNHPQSLANSDTSSERSFSSCYYSQSYQTQSTSNSSGNTGRPRHVQWKGHDDRLQEKVPQYFDDRSMQQSPPASPASSVETYASTVDSESEQPLEVPEYDVPEYTGRPPESAIIAATPSEFSDLFPSSRRLDIRHDDTTIDGNMNLRVDTEVSLYDRQCAMTLFHLRLQDLKRREFSLRRYCRNSGREICHSVTKAQASIVEKRPGFQRSLSNALQSMRPKVEQRNSHTPTQASLKRNDSGYESMHSFDFDRDYRPTSAGDDSASHGTPPPSSFRLEFSNYAQVEVKRTSTKGSKRYEFEYWGVHYAWYRVVQPDHGVKRVALHLRSAGSDRTLAYIEPVVLPPKQAEHERDSGGWIPPCTMRIVDEAISGSELRTKDLDHTKHVADTVIATGLIALVDDSIRTHFDYEHTKLFFPIPRLNVGVEYIGPKRLINDMFNRKESSSRPQSRPSSSSGPPATGTTQSAFQRISLSRRQSGR